MAELFRGCSFTAYECALSNYIGTTTLVVPFYRNPASERNGLCLEMATIVQHKWPELYDLSHKILVQTNTLDLCLPGEQVGFLKVDVEGAELEVLQGGVNLLRLERPNILIEIEERHRSGATVQVPQFLASLGYKLYFLLGNELLPFDDFDTLTMQQGKFYPGERDESYPHYVRNFFAIPNERARLVDKMRARLS